MQDVQPRATDPNGELQYLSCTADRKLLVSVSGAGGGGTSQNIGTTTVGGAGTIALFQDPGNLAQPGNLDASGNLKVTSAPSTSATSALTNVPENLASVTLLAANSARLAFEIFNDSDGTLLVKPGAVASLTSASWRVFPRDKLTTKDIGVNWTGRLDGIWETTPGTAGHAAARVTELTT